MLIRTYLGNPGIMLKIIILTTFMTVCLNPAFAHAAGYDVVMAPTSHTYFDYYQGPGEKEPLAIGGYLPLKKVYQYNPIPKAIPADKAKHVLGVQGQLWGEYISTP